MALSQQSIGSFGLTFSFAHPSTPVGSRAAVARLGQKIYIAERARHWLARRPSHLPTTRPRLAKQRNHTRGFPRIDAASKDLGFWKYYA